ncbi:hypothetical protein [Candidatus Laterigemmans baculatus]|uniref:hypothetical protein n=1 Tax=Candidatus Laterigemmans baculatus TaxID=2770505 RepID=UPI0013DCB2FC|nr:hypothetical protein [Candidatus Laterigemmans baculatus]
MFRFGRASDPGSPIRWTQLLPLLEDDDRRAAVEREFPEPGRESFFSALRRTAPEAAESVLSAGRQLHAAAPLAKHPTVAVAGMLNSGKTSLVATFLSPAGRRRTLRGESNKQGTHRFVLWLPSRWQEDAELWGLLVQRIGDALGHAPEMLSEDPQTAHDQYNNQSGGEGALAIPLVATDPGLDAVGMGLLDCPDIVSDAAFGRGSPEIRRDLLRRAAKLCSGFIIVTGGEAIRDATLGDLLRIATELMPGVHRLLAVNKVRPRQTPDQLWENTRSLVEHHRVDALYAAYDYEVPAAEPFIPKTAEPEERVDDDDRLPKFFRVSEDPDDNPPATLSADRLLASLPASLDRTELFEQVRLALEEGLRKAVWDEGIDRLAAAAEEATKEAQRMRHDLLLSALDFFARREPGGKISELRLHQSERIVRQLTQAFADAAPWYARFGMQLNSRLRKLWGGAGDLVERLTPSQMASSAANSIKEKIKVGKQGSVLTPERLRDAIMPRVDLSRLPGIDSEETLIHRGSRAIERFDDEDFTSLDPHRLQLAVGEVWRQMPVTKKLKAGLTPLAVVFAAFGAALMIPLDFGGTGVIAFASIKELLFAAGLSVAGAAWGGGLTSGDVEQQAARQQLSNFLAVLCDALGVPRWTNEGTPITIEVAGRKLQLPEPTIAPRPSADAALVQWHLRDEFIRELQQQLPRR